MKNFFHSLAFASLFAFCLPACSATAVTHPGDANDRLLDSGWQFRAVAGSTLPSGAEGAAGWQMATIPGTVQTDLLAAKLIPDPFYRDNEMSLQWVGLTDWEYQTHFNVTAAELARQHVELVFDGLDTYADVFVNGRKLLNADNMFRRWRVDAKSALHPGSNELRIVFYSPVSKMMPVVKAMPYILPTIAQNPINKEMGALVEPYVRKAPYNFGWDWGPTYVTAGIWHPVHLVTWDALLMEDSAIMQPSVNKLHASLAADVTLEASSSGAAEITVNYAPLRGDGTGPWAPATRMAVSLSAGENHVSAPFQIAHPKLWWPNGYGAQDRYVFRITVSRGGNVLAQRDIRTGLRSVELRRQKDQWGKSYEFVVNGVPVFAKGADVIPFDSFAPRVTPELHRKILTAARDANMNMLRDWGGGYYESDDYYDTADELGLMIWQEFAFGGAMIPGTPEFRANVAEEAKQQVLRLRNHPSVVFWCGNNEVETGWQHWGDRLDFAKTLTPEQRQFVWQSYLLVMSDILQQTVARYSPDTPYMPSSPSNNYDEQADSDTNGDRHYWSVWHQLTPISEYNNQHPRFMSEFGFQSFPDMETIRSFTVPGDLAIDSAVMKEHQKNNGGNDRIHTYMLREYNEPKDFASFVYLSQVQQAEAIKVGAENFRRSRPRTMGSLYWQLNDCWPVASWSSIDYYGRWKALHYYARRFYSPVLVSPYIHDGTVDTYVVSDLQKGQPATLHVSVMNFDGKVLSEKDTPITLAPLSSHLVSSVPVAALLNGADPHTVFAQYEIRAGGQTLSSNQLYFDVTKSLALPVPKIEASWSGDKLTLSSATLARDVFVSFPGANVSLSDNYITLLPGRPQTVTVSGIAPDAAKGAMRITSLTEAWK